MERLFKNSRKRVVATALAFLMVCSMVPMVWTAVSAAGMECGLEEHTHTDECYKLICTLAEGEQYGAHTHSEDCFTQKLVCECAEGVEHTEACYISEQVCTLEEGDDVLLGQHTHAGDCRSLLCEKAEHTHTEACEGSENDVALADGDNINLLAGISELSVSGVWDVGNAEDGHENITFGSDDIATIEHGDDYQSEEVSVRVAATYPAGATDLKLKIELAEGLEWVSNGENSILASALASVSAQQGRSKIYGYTLNNGYYTYSFNEGVESASVTIRVRKSSATNFASITDSIKATVTCTENGETFSETASLKNLQCEQFSYIGYDASHREKVVKAEEIAFDFGLVTHNYYSGSGIYHHRLYDYAEVTVTAPKGVTLATTDVNHTEGGSISHIVVDGWHLLSTDDSAEDVTKYTICTENFRTQVIGTSFEWIFPEELAGQTVSIIYSDMKWKLYGDDTVRTLKKNYTRKTDFIIVSSSVKTNELV